MRCRPHFLILSVMPAALSLLAVVSPALAQGGPPGGERPALVEVRQAQIRDLAPVSLIPGTVISRDDARVAAEVSGVLESVAEVGTEVAAGDVVAGIDERGLRLQITELRAEVERISARLDYLRREEQRFNELEGSSLISTTQLDETRTNARVSANELDAARARVAQLEDQLSRTSIRAPFPGVVVERLARAGERVAPGDEVLRIINPERLEVVARPPLTYYRYVSRGDLLDLQLEDEVLSGVVRTKVSLGDENTHVFDLRLDIPPDSLPAGRTLRVRIPMAASREVLVVPRDALVLRADSIAVFIVEGDGSARRIPVRTGIASGEWIEVLSDELLPGAAVVVRGNERLRPGQQLQVMNAGNATGGVGPDSGEDDHAGVEAGAAVGNRD